MKTTKINKPGDLIRRHQKALAKGKMPKESMATEKVEVKLMKAGAKSLKRKSKKSNKKK